MRYAVGNKKKVGKGAVRLPRILVPISSSEQACVGTVSALSDETYHLWATVAAGAQQQRARGVLLPTRPLQSRIVARAVGEGAPSRAHGGGERALLGREIIAAGLQLGGRGRFPYCAYTAWAPYFLNKIRRAYTRITQNACEVCFQS